MKYNFGHIINPVIVGEGSDLLVAQPVTFKTMERAKLVANNNGIDVTQCAAFYAEDESLVPEWMIKTPELERSILDFLPNLPKPKKLPLIKDILDRLAIQPDITHMVYTNVDIALKPNFYVRASKLLNKGYKSLIINRRTIRDDHQNINQMYNDYGKPHPGYDCFIFPVGMYKRMSLANVVIGAPFIGKTLKQNLQHFGGCAVLKEEHLTFHIGEDRQWIHNIPIKKFNQQENKKAIRGLRNG